MIGLEDMSLLGNQTLYSGYFNITSSKRLHYFFVEASDAAKKPWALWLNGGPGCSSMEGLFTENGPFKLASNGTLKPNPYSWTNLTSILYLESPIGVGFSYSSNPSDMDKIGDRTATNDAARALLTFLSIFKEFATRDFYVTGESYAGKYVPRLMRKLAVLTPFDRILKGAAIGNGYFSERLDYNSRMFYYAYHGLIGMEEWRQMSQLCCDGKPDQCDFYAQTNSDDCAEACAEASSPIWLNNLNVYNIYTDCAPLSIHTQLRLQYDSLPPKVKNLTKTVTMAPPCTNDKLIWNYLNNKKVQSSLHVSLPASITKWELCSDDVYERYHKLPEPMTSFFADFWHHLPNGRVMLYAGDIDIACNFLGVESFATSLNRTQLRPYNQWTLTKDGTRQIGGFVRRFDQLTFVTVRGAGHMVPTDRAVEAYAIYKRFIMDKW